MTLRSILRAAGALSATAVVLLPAALTGTAYADTTPDGTTIIKANPTEQPCSALTGSLSGHFRGSDGQFVNATLTLTLSDSKNREVDGEGCFLNHDSPGLMVNPNFALPSSGSLTEGTDEWAVSGLPADAKYVHIEVYPRGAASSPTALRTDTSHYGRTMVKLTLPNSSDVQVIVPRDDNCPSASGVGSAWVDATDVHVTRKSGAKNGMDIASVSLSKSKVTLADAFSAWADSKNVPAGAEGLSLGGAPVDDRVFLPNLLGGGLHGQPYTLVVRTSHYGGKAYSTDYRGRQTFGVTSCTATVAHVMVLPGSLSKAERHQVADWLLKHVKHQFLVTNNL